MKRIIRYILIIITIVYFPLLFVLTTLTAPDLSLWISIPLFIVLTPITGIPIMMMWELFNEWDNPGSPFFRWLHGLP